MKETANGTQIYIVHGYGASPDNHWFPWLKEELSAQGADVTILRMPTPQNPDVKKWVGHLSLLANRLNNDTYFVAHSLGCISVLRYLEEVNFPEPIGGFILVSGFAKPLPDLEELNEFVQTPLDDKLIIQKVKKRAVIASKDDAVVPFAFSKKLAERLQADFHTTDHCGHFLDSEGFTTLPIVYTLLTKMMNIPPQIDS